MDCLRLEVLLRYVEAETSPDEAEEIRRHMEQCRYCRQEVGAMQGLVLSLGKLAGSEGHEPRADAECVEVMTLAAYIDQRLPGPERERVERHVANCQTCLDELVAAVQRLEAITGALQPIPARLVEQAVALGTPEPPAAVSRWHPLRHRLQEWMAVLARPPQWVWAGSGVAVAVMLTLYLVLSPLREPTAPVVPPHPGQQPSGYGFGTSAEVLVQGNVRLSRELRSALLAYQEHPTPASRDTLLVLLDHASLGLPVEQVSAIEIKHSLQATLASAQEGQPVQVTLLQDGLLVIEEAPSGEGH